METIERDGGNKFQKSYFDVVGLCCSSEVPLIEKILNSLDGIKDFSVVVPTKTLIVVHDSLLVSQIQIVKALNESRLEANVRVIGNGSYKNKWPSPYAIACGTFLLLSFFKYLYSPFRWLAVAAIVVGIPPIILKALASLRNFRLDINILMLIAVAGSIALRDYWEAATIVFLFTISEWLESRASHKATAVMSSLVSVVPQKAVIAESGLEINADEVKLGTVLAVKAGQVIPIDGVVVEGSCEVDEKIMTGESFPVMKQKESSVWASTINLNGYISIKTTVVAEDCVVARMAKIVEEAQNKKSKTQRFLDKCAMYYTPAIVVISASLAIVPLAFHVHNKSEWFHLALVVLVSGCPCALLLSTPVAMFCALSKAATLGVLFKGAQHLETLARIKIMAFDKTGTITRGEFEVLDFRSLRPQISLNELLFWISSIESKSSHPMAAALIDFARTHSIEPKPDRVEHFHNFPGEGISGKIEDNIVYIGNKKIASKAGCSTVPELEGYDIEGKSVGYVFLGSSLVAVFSLTDVCRTGAKEAIEELNSLGIKTIMLTGDCNGAAKRAQEQLGGALNVIRAELLPEDKARAIKEFQEEGPAAMIGDGLNDAPALATADIGISMGIGGSALATESGDVVLMTNDIQRIPKALRIARRVRRKIIENVILSILTKAAIIGLAIGGHPLVWAAVLADVGTCLLVIFNSMLLLRGTNNSKSHSHIHNHKHSKSLSSSCCDKESQKLKSCSSRKCASECGDKKCSNSIKEHGHNGHSHPHSGKGDHGLESCKPHNHGCCGEKKSSSFTKEHCHEGKVKVDNDLKSQNQHSHGCCGEKKSSSSSREHCHQKSEDIVEVDHDLESQNHHNHGCCGTKKSLSTSKEPFHQQCEDKVQVDHDLESQNPHSHGCCGAKKSSSSIKEHCHEESEDIVEVDHDLESQKQHSHGCCGGKKGSSFEHFHQQSENIVEVDHHSHGDSCGTKKCSSKEGIVEDHEHKHDCSTTGCEDQETQTCQKHNCSTTVDNEKSDKLCLERHHVNHGDDHERDHCTERGPGVSAGCNAVCTGSKMMHRGCCDSFRRECCIRSGHFEANFRGGLSEIVID